MYKTYSACLEHKLRYPWFTCVTWINIPGCWDSLSGSFYVWLMENATDSWCDSWIHRSALCLQPLHEKHGPQVYWVGMCSSCCRGMWILISGSGRLFLFCWLPPLLDWKKPTTPLFTCVPARHQEFNLDLPWSHDCINDCFCFYRG